MIDRFITVLKSIVRGNHKGMLPTRNKSNNKGNNIYI